MGRDSLLGMSPTPPALRCSPGRELRAEPHKRGRSLESGMLFRDKDDDLALFNEMQTKEQDDFLLRSTDDFEDTFSSKLRYFSDYKLGISIPVRGESSDLLNADGEKNDYDWLLTPPDTPLFPSLDDDAPPIITVQRGRTLSQPIKISRSSTLERNYRSRSNRGSASPQRLSPSPRTGSNMHQARGRVSSPPLSSPSAVGHASPSRHRSPTPSKPSAPVRRPSTPTPPRMSTGSSGNTASSRTRGTSPVTTTRGKSASPKISAWHSNIPGFPSDVPPNLRTSLGDRKPSYVRGSSPASRNGRDSSSKFTRQSMSPTPSRSGSSLHSQERDRFSSNSKGSIASSGDDDVDSLQSVPIGSSDHSTSRRVGTLSNNRALANSKKPNKMISPSSAPKRSFDYAMRQMDHKKTPQNMFRPLLSSVPTSTFYAGKVNSAHRTMISRNSSVGTSSTASSDQGMSGALDTEGSDHIQDDMTSHYEKVPVADMEDEVFVFDSTDALDEDGNEVYDSALQIPHMEFDDGPATTSDHYGLEDFGHSDSAVVIAKNSDALYIEGNISENDRFVDMSLCSSCGCSFSATEPVDMDVKLCPDCRREDGNLIVTTPVTSRSVEISPVKSVESPEEYSTSCKPDLQPVGSPEVSKQINICEVFPAHEEDFEQHDACNEQSQSGLLDNPPVRPLEAEAEQRHEETQAIDQSTTGCSLLTSDFKLQSGHSSDSPNSCINVSEGAGISILLKRSSSSKGPFQGRIFSASFVPHSDPLYARESTTSVRSSIGHGSASASSSVDMTSARQMENRVQRQLSAKKFNVENNGSLSSGTPNHAHQASVGSSTHEENLEWSLCSRNSSVVEDTPIIQEGFNSEDKEVDDMDTPYNKGTVCEENNSERDDSSRTLDASAAEMSRIVSVRSEENSEASNKQDSVSFENVEDLHKHRRSYSDIEASALTPDSHQEEDNVLINCMDDTNLAKVPLGSVSEIEHEDKSTHDSETDLLPKVAEKNADESHEPSYFIHSDKELTPSIPEVDPTNIPQGILENSTVMIEGHRGSKARSLTLEEATDTILFCSSIVQNLAYQAANIAIEKENSVLLEGSRPTVTILGKNSPEKKNPRGRNPSKRTTKSHKARQMHVETENRNPSNNTEMNEKASETFPRSVGLSKVPDTNKPPKLESKCNCTIM